MILERLHDHKNKQSRRRGASKRKIWILQMANNAQKAGSRSSVLFHVERRRFSCQDKVSQPCRLLSQQRLRDGAWRTGVAARGNALPSDSTRQPQAV